MIETPTYDELLRLLRHRKRPAEIARRSRDRRPGRTSGSPTRETTASRSSTPAANSSPSSAPLAPATASSTSRPRWRSTRKAISGSPNAGNNRVQKFSPSGRISRQVRQLWHRQRPVQRPRRHRDRRQRQHLGLRHLQRPHPGVQRRRRIHPTSSAPKALATASSANRPGSTSTPKAMSGSPTGRTTGSRSSAPTANSSASSAPAGTGDGQFNRPDALDIDKPGQRLGRRPEQRPRPAVRPRRQLRRPVRLQRLRRRPVQLQLPDGDRGRLQGQRLDRRRQQQPGPGVARADRPRRPMRLRFGSYGTGDGQLKSPGDVAVGVEGDLWVADKGNNRIEKFDAGRATSLPSSEHTAQATASSTGRPRSPSTATEICLSPTPTTTESRSSDPDGEFISKFGSAGSGNGQFSAPKESPPTSRAISGSPTPTTAASRSSTKKANSSASSAPKALAKARSANRPGSTSIAEGNVWVADWQNNRVEEFSSDGRIHPPVRLQRDGRRAVQPPRRSRHRQPGQRLGR